MSRTRVDIEHNNDKHHLSRNPSPDSKSISRNNQQDPETSDQISNALASSPSDFTVIWRNLTYEVDTRPLYTKVRDRLANRGTDRKSSDINIEDGTNISLSDSVTSNPKKVILNRICGDAKSRQLTGILGPSGAGKSTLLSCLFQNRTDGTKGQILVDREIKGKLKVCFIPQHDYLNEWLTVREDLIFVSRLKFAKVSALSRRNSERLTGQARGQSECSSFIKQKSGKFTTVVDHEANALRVAELLGLNNCLDVRVKNISGGQKKRLSIARELMSKPDVLILDEPTTGLDSLTCYKTMVVLRDLALLSPHPMAVIVTIHQPPRSVFNLFDKAYFLSRNGHVMYDGRPSKVVETLDQVAGIKLPVPNYNPASLLIEIATDDSQSNIVESLTAHNRTTFEGKYDINYLTKLMKTKPANVNQNWNFCKLKDKSSVYSLRSMTLSNSPTTDSLGPNQDRTEEGTSINMAKLIPDQTHENEIFDTNNYFISYELRNCLSSHSSSILESFRHIFILTHRSWLSVIRNPSMTRSRFIFHAMLPLIMVLIFSDSSGKVNNCPPIETELDMTSMVKSLKDGQIAKNVDEIRLGAQNLSFFFISLYGLGINIISCTASFYPLTINMFKKETINGLYAPAPYFIGQMLAELPLEIILPIMSIALSYHLTGQEPSYLEWRMFMVAFIFFLNCYTIHALGLLCGAMFINNVNLSVLVGQALLFPPCMLSGFVLRPDRMPHWLKILSYGSFYRLSLSGILASRYGFNVCDCDEETIGNRVGFTGMPPNIKHVLEYMFPKNASSNDDFEVTEIFDSLGERFVKAQTFALDIKSCADVKPYTMIMFSVYDSDLLVSIVGLLIMIIIFKSITFQIMRSFPQRIRC